MDLQQLTDRKLRSLVGDLVVQVTIAQARIEELESQLAEKESGTGRATEGT